MKKMKLFLTLALFAGVTLFSACGSGTDEAAEAARLDSLRKDSTMRADKEKQMMDSIATADAAAKAATDSIAALEANASGGNAGTKGTGSSGVTGGDAGTKGTGSSGVKGNESGTGGAVGVKGSGSGSTGGAQGVKGSGSGTTEGAKGVKGK